MNNHNVDRLVKLDACSEGIGRAAKFSTLREWWDGSDHRGDMMRLVGRAHSDGTMTRQCLVAVTLRCLETVMHSLPDASVADLRLLAEWCGGRDDVDRVAISDRLRRACYASHYATKAATYHATKGAAYYEAYYKAYYAAFAAYHAALSAYVSDGADDAAANVAAWVKAPCDVIRDAITIDELCVALKLHADEGVKP